MPLTSNMTQGLTSKRFEHDPILQAFHFVPTHGTTGPGPHALCVPEVSKLTITLATRFETLSYLSCLRRSSSMCSAYTLILTHVAEVQL